MLESWKDNLRTHSLRVGFQLSLTRPQIEMISAIADDVSWDRHYGSCLAFPDNFLATNRSLIKRGLIEERPKAEYEAEMNDYQRPAYTFNHFKLTPAGLCVVELLKMVGLFIESDRKADKEAYQRSKKKQKV